MDLHIRPSAAVTAACALCLVTACLLAACRGPTIGVVPPTEPITLNINITVQQEVRVKLEEDVATLLDREEGVSSRDVPGELDALGGELASREPEIEGFKARGLVGERYDGLLGVVGTSAPADLHALVARVNDARQAAYADIAQRHAAPIADVQALAAKTRIEGAPAGEYVMLEPGVWKRV
jgi:uncharacterized protein YdbL (DUF1318 family)